MNTEVKPDEWILENRIGFNKNIYNTFNRKNYKDLNKKESCKCDEEKCDIDIKTVSLFPHQRILRDYIQFDSPYRGILAYHELGSGKSAASIAAAEGFIGKRQIYVLTPASLAKNYENELMKISTIGLNMKKSWSLLKIKGMGKSKKLIEKLNDYGINTKFIKKDNLVWIPLYNNDMDDDVDIIQKNINYNSITKQDKQKIDETILHIIRNRYTFISYNGLTQKMISDMGKKMFDNSFVIVDEIHNFISRIVNGSKLARAVYNNLMKAENCKMVLLSGTPIINNPYEIATLINLIRGPMKINNLKLLTTSKEPTIELIKKKIKSKEYEKYIDYLFFKNSVLSIALLPEGYMRKNKGIEIEKKEWKITESKLISNIKDLLNDKEIKFGAKIGEEYYYALPNETDEFNKLFIDNTNDEKPEIKNIDLFQRRILGTVSYYRTSGSEFFPELYPINIKYLNMTNHQLSIYDEVRTKERAIDEGNKFKRKGVLDEKNSVYRAFSRMVCNFAFPTEIKRTFPQDIRKILKKELDIHEEEDKNEEKMDIKTVVAQQYEESLTKALSELETSDYLSKENLKKKYSPKYYEMLNDIETSPGSVLIYSQFRSVEGLGIFIKTLDKQEYKQISLIKTEQGYEFENLSVFDEKYDSKRYIIFSNDREKTNQLMHLFNGDYKQLDQNLFNSLPDRIKNDSKYQLYGKLIKTMMITQSGAEGISLKNVRRVLVMEYFWNSVRINQVIGRAVRTCSHELLPKSERNVEVFCYLMKLTKQQLDKNFTIKSLDKGITTDEHIYNIASSKENLINQFLKLLKAASFDCIINSNQNKPLQSGYKCYNWPINVDNSKLSFTKDINNDNKILAHDKLKKKRKGRGKVVIINDIKYVDFNKKLYDYESYINAGILLPIQK